MQSKNTNNAKVIDVSVHQGVIDWAAVAADGVQGVLIKATEGVGYRDPKLLQNAAGAAAAGLKIGYYHYARPETGNTVLAEVSSFLAVIDGLPIDLPLVLDVEDDAAKLGAIKLTDWSYTWLSEVQIRSGHRVMLYTGASFARSYLGSKLAEFPLWVAHYGALTPMANSTWDKWAVFQYTDKGSVSGISGNVDMNEMDLAFWQEITAEKQIEEEENDMTKKLEFEHDWQWDQLATALDGLYHKGLFGDYNWAEKASKREITVADALFLNSVMLARQNGVDV